MYVSVLLVKAVHLDAKIPTTPDLPSNTEAGSLRIVDMVDKGAAPVLVDVKIVAATS